MRDGFFWGGAFWGLLLIVWGVLALLRSFFNINLPVFRILVALFFIYMGVSVLVGGFGHTGDKNTVLFGERTIPGDPAADEYNIIFGSGVIDLTRLTPVDRGHIEVNVIFGGGTVKINPEIPIRIHASSAFGSASLPNGSATFFGEQTYTTKAAAEGVKMIELKVSTVFGSVTVIE
ncbi:MAG: hypothetical protein HPY55_01415 [Firmicutes bacterium]|nr:hypothetical protein [Bacillota bacterium]